MTPVIYCDLDGVLVDFVTGSLALHNAKITHAQVSQWGIEELLGIDPKEFWDALGFSFWANLEAYDDGLHVLAAAESLVGAENVVLVSSPCDTPGCDEGKRAWVNKHLPGYKRRTFLGAEKHKLAAPCKVLIDDHTSNVNNFIGRRGQTVLPPRPWNIRRGECTPEGHFDPACVILEIKSAIKQAEESLRK